MPTVRRSLEVAVPAAELFALAQDYALRPKWDLVHGDFKFLDGTSQGPGAHVWYRAQKGVAMRVRYISYRPPTTVAMSMTSGPWFFERFSGAWNFRAIDTVRTNVVFQYEFRLRPRWLNGTAGRVVAMSLGQGRRGPAARVESLRGARVAHEGLRQRSDRGPLGAQGAFGCGRHLDSRRWPWGSGCPLRRRS